MTASALLLLAAAAGAEAQQPGKVPRVGVLTFTQMPESSREAFRQGLRDHGFAEGQNILIEWRAAEGRTGHANRPGCEKCDEDDPCACPARRPYPDHQRAASDERRAKTV